MAKNIFSAKAIMAPMAGVTDLPFRTILRGCGNTFAFTEMLAVKPLLTQSHKSLFYLRSDPTDKPLGAQLVGNDPDMLAHAAQILESQHLFSVIDLNCGCPVKKVVSKGEGSALLKNPHLIEKIVCAMKKAVSLPITCKIRSGWCPDTINAIDIAKRVEGAGADAITVHARTKHHGYSGGVDRTLIAAVKKAVSIPVVGNGNIFTKEDADRMFAETGCDHVMVARGALGNPWIFNEIETGKSDERAQTIVSIHNTLLLHSRLLIDFYGERKGVLLLRKIGCWYFKYFARKAHYKLSMSKINTYAEFLDIVDAYVNQHET